VSNTSVKTISLELEKSCKNKLMPIWSVHLLLVEGCFFIIINLLL
jgi:hypothetical protein